MSQHRYFPNGDRRDVEVHRWRGLSSFLLAGVRAFDRWRTRTKTLRELRRINPRLLYDIGLNPEDLRTLADNLSAGVSSPGTVEAGSTTRGCAIHYLGTKPDEYTTAASSKRAA